MSRDALDRTHLVYTDINDQKAETHLLIIEDSPVHRAVFTVDRWIVEQHQIVAYDSSGNHVVTFSPLFPWKVIEVSRIEKISSREVQEFDFKDRAEVDKYRKELSKQYKPIKLPSTGGDVAGFVESDVDSLVLPTGQYL